MTMDDAIEAFAHSDTFPLQAIRWVLDEWDATGPICRTLLHGYVTGTDLSERTEQALYVVTHLMAEKADTASFPDLCALAMDADRASSVFGEDGGIDVLPCLLVSTFDGDVRQLHRLIETPTTNEFTREDLLMALAYLARTRRIPESELYDYMAALPDRLHLDEDWDVVWLGWARAIAALGFAGLSGRVEQVFQRGLIDPSVMSPADFWIDLREGQDDPHGMSGQVWDDIGPIDDAVEWLMRDTGRDEDDDPAPPEPVRNPLRHVGRNDPCPCGSGKKYKKCCLAA